MKTTDEKIVDAIMAWLIFFWIIFGACVVGLTLAIGKAILMAFGIETIL